jgi:hypothetical protein
MLILNTSNLNSTESNQKNDYNSKKNVDVKIYTNLHNYNRQHMGQIWDMHQESTTRRERIPTCLDYELVTNIRIQYTTPEESYNGYYRLICAISHMVSY